METLMDRRAFVKCGFIAGLTVAQRLLFPQAVHADSSDVKIEGFPWSRSEVLFGSNSGFGTFEDRPSVLVGVYIDKNLNAQVALDAMQSINNLKRKLTGTDIFIPVDESLAQVRLLHWESSEYLDYVKAHPGYRALFSRCDALIAEPSLKIVAHALLHSLGIVDFVPSADFINHLQVNPQIYDSHGVPIDSVMSWKFLFDDSIKNCLGKDDINLLQLAGYGNLAQS